MKKLIWDDDVEELDLGDGDFITISSNLTVKDMTVVSSGETQMETSLALLKRLIRSWRGPSFEREGKPVECIAENIERLDASVATIVSQRMAERINGEGMTDEERKDSTPSLLPISTDL